MEVARDALLPGRRRWWRPTPTGAVRGWLT